MKIKVEKYTELRITMTIAEAVHIRDLTGRQTSAMLVGVEDQLDLNVKLNCSIYNDIADAIGKKGGIGTLESKEPS